MKEKFRTTVRTANPGKLASGIAAVEVALHYLLDYGAKEAVLFLEALLILGQEPVKVMKQHAVEHGTFRMTGTGHSCHSRGSFIKKRANLMDMTSSP